MEQADHEAQQEMEVEAERGGDAAEEPSIPMNVRAGAWNAHDEAMVLSCVKAAKLLGGSAVEVQYGAVKARIEVKHNRADGDPKVLAKAREVQLQRIEAQQQRMEVAKVKVDGKAEAKRNKRKARREKEKSDKKKLEVEAEEKVKKAKDEAQRVEKEEKKKVEEAKQEAEQK